jgi:hypothetical protein
MSPETMAKGIYSDKRFGLLPPSLSLVLQSFIRFSVFVSDVWMFGCALYELLEHHGKSSLSSSFPS